MVKASPLGAIVLCGGRSRRMGRDKASLPFGGETLLERVVRHVAAATSDIVLAAAPGQSVPDGFRVSRDVIVGEGPLPGLLAALDTLEADRVFVIACDMPLLQPALIELLVDLSEGWDGAVPVIDGRPVPTCAVYKTAALQDARAGFGDLRHRSLRDFVTRIRVREVSAPVLQSVDPQLLSFTPCNTPDEYRRAWLLAGLDVNGPPPDAV